MSKGILREKSYAFSLRIVKLHDFFVKETKAFALANQIVRSGTSIGADVMEASQAESRPDFIHKLSISNKEAFETEYWLSLLRASSLSDSGNYQEKSPDLAIFTPIFR